MNMERYGLRSVFMCTMIRRPGRLIFFMEADDSRQSIHPGDTKMYLDVKGSLVD